MICEYDEKQLAKEIERYNKVTVTALHIITKAKRPKQKNRCYTILSLTDCNVATDLCREGLKLYNIQIIPDHISKKLYYQTHQCHLCFKYDNVCKCRRQTNLCCIYGKDHH